MAAGEQPASSPLSAITSARAVGRLQLCFCRDIMVLAPGGHVLGRQYSRPAAGVSTCSVYLVRRTFPKLLAIVHSKGCPCQIMAHALRRLLDNLPKILIVKLWSRLFPSPPRTVHKVGRRCQTSTDERFPVYPTLNSALRRFLPHRLDCNIRNCPAASANHGSQPGR